MKIDRNNYEEFFILYMDNELSSEDRRRVEIFAQENTDLKEELHLLLQSKLVVDETIVFDNKEALLKHAGNVSLNTTNYEEWFVLYTDNELTAAQKNEVEVFVAAHPSLQKELQLLQQTKLQPESVIFPYKESLYRTEEKVRVIGIRWQRIAVAAALLLAISTAAFFALNKKEAGTTDIADNGKGTEIKTSPATKETKEPLKEIQPAENKIADVRKEETLPVPVENNTEETASTTNKTKQPKQEKQYNTPVQKLIPDDAALAVQEKIKTPGNNLPKPINNPYVIDDKKEFASIQAEPSVKQPLTILKEITGNSSVTTNEVQPLYSSITSTTSDDDGIDAEQPRKKNKLRGFFRKVTRTFEKTTNIKATDDEDRLLIGGLAIRL